MQRGGITNSKQPQVLAAATSEYNSHLAQGPGLDVVEL